MRADGLRSALEHLCLADGGLTDGQLLARFIDGREEAAFAALVRRHGPMVLGVCRRILGNRDDAEDAFQAAFLVLARKAASVVRREAVASFLYGVAYRTALRARMRVVRRRAMERQVEDMPHPEVPPAEPQDWQPLLDRELSRLPEKYRAPLVLCDLECKPRREAARQLGLVEGKLASRLATARRMLAGRLLRCGLTLSGGALAVALAERATAAVPARLAVTTVRAAALVAAGQTAGVATPAAVLMNEVLRAMLMTKLKIYGAVAVVAAMLGVGGLAFRASGQDRVPPPAEKRADTGGRSLTEVELLRREVDILKLQMEVVQAELRALKGKGGAGAKPTWGMPADKIPSYNAYAKPAPDAAPNPTPQPGPGNKLPPTFAPDLSSVPARDAEPPPSPDLKPGPGGPYVNRLPSGHDPLQEAEAALKQIREARDTAEQRRAADALERALKRLKERTQSDDKAKRP
jgi:RNA polymerase sigma factor (sigma-70 family)